MLWDCYKMESGSIVGIIQNPRVDAFGVARRSFAIGSRPMALLGPVARMTLLQRQAGITFIFPTHALGPIEQLFSDG